VEELVRLAAKPIAYIGCTVIFLGLLHLGMNLRDGCRAGGGELRKAIAMSRRDRFRRDIRFRRILIT